MLVAISIGLLIAACTNTRSSISNGNVERSPVALMVVPHPDDELMATATIEPIEAAGYELVMLLLTDGEATRRCEDERGSEACRTRRVEAWEQVADAIGIDASNRLRAGLPDGAVTRDAAIDAICAAAATLAADDRPVALMIAASYFGGDGEVAVVYEHDDHDVTNQAVIAQQCVGVPRLIRIPANESPDVVWRVDTNTHAALLGNDGVAQQAYGWLAFDFVTGDRLEAWMVSEDDRYSPFGRKQGFACFDAAGTVRGTQHCALG